MDSRHAAIFAEDVASALAAQEVPAVTSSAKGTDWHLEISADLNNGRVTPLYTVVNTKGLRQGNISTPPVSADTWVSANPIALTVVAQRDAPAIATLLTSIEAAVQESDPNSLQNRPPRVMLSGVTGAPGDGNEALRIQISRELASAGLSVQTTPQGADFQLSGVVQIAPATPGQSRVEIQWTVRDPYGREAGHLLQMNDVPTGSLNSFWGDVALVVAQEAAGGVRDVIVNQTAAHRIGIKPSS